MKFMGPAVILFGRYSLWSKHRNFELLKLLLFGERTKLFDKFSESSITRLFKGFSVTKVPGVLDLLHVRGKCSQGVIN